MLDPNFKIPDKIRITPKDVYSVVYAEFSDPTLMGECDPNTKQIRLRLGLPQDIMFWTFWHELFHAISFAYDLELTESQVTSIEKALLRILNLNGKRRRRQLTKKEKRGHT